MELAITIESDIKGPRKGKKNKKKLKVTFNKENVNVDDNTAEEIEDSEPNDIRCEVKDILTPMRQLNS